MAAFTKWPQMKGTKPTQCDMKLENETMTTTEYDM